MTIRSVVSRAAIAAALLLTGAVAGVRAETVQSQNPNAFTVTGAPTAPRKSLQWDANGKWTVNLDMDQPVGRDMALKDVSAGAFFHITPSMRVGGSVGLGDKFAEPDKIVPQDTSSAPRVRVETKFKF